MKSLRLITAIVCATVAAGTAQAQIVGPRPYAGPQSMPYLPPPPPPPQVFQESYACTPGYDPQDHNPPTIILVNVMVRSHKVQAMEVMYDLRNGERVYRSRQYNAVLKYDPTVYAGWTGSRVTDSGKVMAGGLYWSPNGHPYYREKLWENGRVAWDYTAPCQMQVLDSNPGE
jgi:hypothetical protein